MNAQGKVPAAALLGFGTASAPDGTLAVLRLGYRDTAGDQSEKTLQLALLPEHLTALIETLTKLKARLEAKASQA